MNLPIIFHGMQHMQIALRYSMSPTLHSLEDVSRRRSQEAKFCRGTSHVVSVSINARDLHDKLNSILPRVF